MRKTPMGRPAIFVTGYAALILIGAVDYLTGFDIDVSIFYLIPIGFVAWRLGRRLGLLFALSGAIVWLIADNLSAHQYDLPAFAPIWNTIIKTAFFAVVVVILTALRRALDREHRQKIALEESNQALEQFSAIASHDLQSPVGQILSYVDLLRTTTDPPLTEKQRGYLDRMQRSALRMRGLIQSLLTLARVKSGAASMVRVSLNDVVREVLTDLSQEIAATRAELVVGPLADVDAVRPQMYQLLLNLISNALKYRRGDVRPHVRVAAHQDGDHVVLSVEDNGMGFDPEEAERLFRPFERLHPQSRVPGSGMGLAICAQIARRHGGTIQADGAPGEGAVFIVRLPSPAEADAVHRRETAVAAGS